jgi:ankyrin repeat protein
MDKSSLSKDQKNKINEFKESNQGILLEHYVNSGDIETIRLLLKHYPDCVDTYNTTYFGETPLFNATESKNFEISKLLLENGANVDAANFEDSTTSLMNSCYNNDTRITKLLLEYNANPDLGNKYGDTALHIACRQGYLEIVKLLLEHNANLNIENRFAGANTPLKLAEREGHGEIDALLKEK